MREAHAYAYGGSAIQDMGYYPFGKQFFSNLTHYVRSGDFVGWLLANAQTIDEYAFAIGALSHYVGDSIGHSEAVNPSTAVEFPKLEHRFGPMVTYDESPHGHIRTEFAFDIGELADGTFVPPDYLQFIGLKVPRKFLELAFKNTYGFDIHELLGRAHPALRSYRTSVRTFIPAFAEAEVVLHRHQFPAHAADGPYRILADRIARTNYERHWSHTYRGPGFKAHLLAVLVFIIPKIGAASDLAIKIPTPETEYWYFRSVNHAVDAFHDMLVKLLKDHNASLALANIDLDTGNPVKLEDYPLTDQTYAQLLERITAEPNRPIPEYLRKNILEYYASSASDPDLSKRLSERLEILMKMKISDDRGQGAATTISRRVP